MHRDGSVYVTAANGKAVRIRRLLVLAVGIEPTFHAKQVFETHAYTVSPRPHDGIESEELQ